MGFLNLRITLFVLTAFMTPMTVNMGAATTQNQSHSRVVYAFWPYWTDPSSYQPDWNVLTYVAYHSWDANSDGTLSAPANINRFNTVKNLLHQNGVKMIISVKSFDKDTLDSIFAYHKDDLANNILNALQTYGADGVNLDFENPRAINIYTDTPNSNLFEEFMGILHEKLKSKNQNYYISLNVAGNVEEVYRNAALSKYTDAVFLRGYNYNSSNSPVTGAPSPYNDIVSSVNLLKNYYPSNKIVLGLYFSGYDWPSSSSEPGSSTMGKGMAVQMKKATANAKMYGRLWDPYSQTPWYRYQVGGAWHQTWYDDDQSLGLKLDYVNSENLGGAGFWALGYEGNNANIWNIVRDKFAIEPMTIVAPAVIPAEIPGITTAKPVETPKAPGFGLMVSLIVLFACAFLARWRMIKILFGIFIILILTINIHAATPQTQVSLCGTLNQPDSVYTLITNVSSAGTCFTIRANNITLEGQGYTVNYSKTRTGYGIVDTAGYDNIIIQNLTLAQKNASITNSHGIYFKNVTNSKVENISITTEGNSSDGVYMYLSDSNYFSGFNIATSGIAAHGIYLKSANSNIIKDSSIVSKSGNDYYLQNTGTVNSFINTNFTTRKIYLYDNSSSFNYSNETNNGIWLNTTLIISPSATLAITRTLINWTQTNISWQEKLKASRRLSYSMSGLLADANYSVWNGSAIDYNLTTDGSGNLPVFKINLSTSAKMIRVVSAQDITPVTPYITSWGNNKTNNNSLIMAVNTSEAVNFNAAANQTITTWNWYQDGVNRNNNYDNFTAFWNTAGTKTVQVNATNSNGTSNTVTWTITVLAQPEIYTPLSPANINSTTGNFWINHTWLPGTGNTTDSYNISVNGTWYNMTADAYYNNTVGPHGWSNITVWAYNSSGAGSLSAGSVSQNTRVPNNPPAQNPMGSKNVIAGNLLTFTVSATDADNDTMTYGTNATAGTLNATTGVYSWITTASDAGTYIWTFSSSDIYGGVASETIRVDVINQGQEIWIKLNNDSGELIVNDSPSLDNGTGLSSATWSIWAVQNKYKLNAGLFGKYQPVAGNRSYVIRTSDVDGISVVLSADGTNVISYSSNTSRDCGIRNNNEWTLITVTYDGSHIIYYRNGVKCDSDSTTINSLRNSPVPLRIGGGNSVFFNGYIDDILMYNKGLPGHQIYRFYQESGHGLAGRQTIPALIYHRVTDPANASDKISTNNFNQQIAYLHDNNFTTITTENFNQWLKGNFTMPRRPVIIFFDDGWNYTYNNALSALDKYSYVGVVPVVTNYANFTDDTSYMRWWQLQELQNKGWEIVSHSIDHVSMLTLNESDFRNELNLSSMDIEKNLGKKPASFIFPYNYANTTYTTICGEYYDLCWAYGSKDTWPYYNDYADNGHVYQSLKRITIYNTTTMQTFKNMFAREISIPIGAWELNEDTGSIAYDSSGNGNNALLNANATWQNDSTISSVISPAINLPGSTQKPKKSQQEPPLPPSETLS